MARRNGTGSAAIAKAYGVLAQQPVDVAALTAKQCANIIISAITDPDGTLHILSRYEDMVWELWPNFEQANVSDCKMKIDWSCIPEDYRDACKAVTYRWWMVGTPGFKPPSAGTLHGFTHR